MGKNLSKFAENLLHKKGSQKGKAKSLGGGVSGTSPGSVRNPPPVRTRTIFKGASALKNLKTLKFFSNQAKVKSQKCRKQVKTPFDNQAALGLPLENLTLKRSLERTAKSHKDAF